MRTKVLLFLIFSLSSCFSDDGQDNEMSFNLIFTFNLNTFVKEELKVVLADDQMHAANIGYRESLKSGKGNKWEGRISNGYDDYVKDSEAKIHFYNKNHKLIKSQDTILTTSIDDYGGVPIAYVKKHGIESDSAGIPAVTAIFVTKEISYFEIKYQGKTLAKHSFDWEKKSKLSAKITRLEAQKFKDHVILDWDIESNEPNYKYLISEWDDYNQRWQGYQYFEAKYSNCNQKKYKINQPCKYIREETLKRSYTKKKKFKLTVKAGTNFTSKEVEVKVNPKIEFTVEDFDKKVNTNKTSFFIANVYFIHPSGRVCHSCTIRSESNPCARDFNIVWRLEGQEDNNKSNVISEAGECKFEYHGINKPDFKTGKYKLSLSITSKKNPDWVGHNFSKDWDLEIFPFQ